MRRVCRGQPVAGHFCFDHRGLRVRREIPLMIGGIDVGLACYSRAILNSVVG